MGPALCKAGTPCTSHSTHWHVQLACAGYHSPLTTGYKVSLCWKWLISLLTIKKKTPKHCISLSAYCLSAEVYILWQNWHWAMANCTERSPTASCCVLSSQRQRKEERRGRHTHTHSTVHSSCWPWWTNTVKILTEHMTKQTLEEQGFMATLILWCRAGKTPLPQHSPTSEHQPHKFHTHCHCRSPLLLFLIPWTPACWMAGLGVWGVLGPHWGYGD